MDFSTEPDRRALFCFKGVRRFCEQIEVVSPCAGRVRVPACNTYFYPDLTVACGEPRFEAVRGIRSRLNPTLIIEVLSDSTEQSDRGNKFRCYQTLDSLQVYVLVSQFRPRIEVYTRQESGSWEYRAFEGLEAVAPLPVGGGELHLADVHVRLTFPPEPGPADSTK